MATIVVPSRMLPGGVSARAMQWAVTGELAACRWWEGDGHDIDRGAVERLLWQQLELGVGDGAVRRREHELPQINHAERPIDPVGALTCRHHPGLDNVLANAVDLCCCTRLEDAEDERTCTAPSRRHLAADRSGRVELCPLLDRERDGPGGEPRLRVDAERRAVANVQMADPVGDMIRRRPRESRGRVLENCLRRDRRRTV